MPFDFSKMHGLGNDYVFVDAIHQALPEDLPALARAVSDRHFGVGSDGLILVGPSDRAPVRMRIFNADGSEAQMCGNGLRCAAKFAFEHGLLADRFVPIPPAMQAVLDQFVAQGEHNAKAVNIETGRGVLAVVLLISPQRTVEKVCVNLDQPILEPQQIPAKLPGPRVVARDFSAAGQAFQITCVSMGNPHAVFFVPDVSTIDLDRIGPLIENHGAFPQRINVHFAQVIDRGHVRMITWERGSGRTMACGTGAGAVAVAGVLEQRTERAVRIELPGGPLLLFWNESDDCVYQLGPAVESFRGQYPG